MARKKGRSTEAVRIDKPTVELVRQITEGGTKTPIGWFFALAAQEKIKKKKEA